MAKQREEAVIVDITPEMPDLEIVDEILVGPEGEILEEEETIQVESEEHQENLVSKLSEEELENIGSDVCEKVGRDISSRKDWLDKYRRGLTALGLMFDKETEESEVFGEINHPLIIEAATQFQARAASEILPPDGPVKTKVLGYADDEVIEQAHRVMDYMNYQLVYEDRGYYDEKDQQLFRLAFSGSEFDKQYFDPVLGRVVSRWVRCEDFVAPYTGKNLESVPRFAHILRPTNNDLLKYQKAGYYENVEDIISRNSDGEQVSVKVSQDGDNVVVDKIKQMDGVEGEGSDTEIEEHEVYEAYVNLDLEIDKDEDGIAKPYIVTVDKETETVLAIYRNWDEEDEYYERRKNFSHKKFLPGFGFYGFGLIHAIGDLNEVATKVLQILLDAGAFASLQGGFKSKDAKIEGDLEMVPGEWKDTEMTAEELQKAFYTPPFKEPSSTLFQLLGAITELGRRFAATTEVMVGDAANTGPVGTTVALIEQGSKVFSGIHKRLHKAMGDEFINIAGLNGLYLEDEYIYATHGGDKAISRMDFDERVDVIPVSDPNIFSSAQRIAMAQSTYQLASTMPHVADMRQAGIRLMQAMRVPDYEDIFPEPLEAERADPVSEGSMIIMGKPVRAYMDQDHQSHIMTHRAMLEMNAIPDDMKGAMMSHMKEHMAMQVRQRIEQQLGMPLPPMNFDTDKTEPANYQSVPPEVENQIAMQSAQIMQQMLQEMKANDPKQQQQSEKIAVAQINAQASAQTKQFETQAEMQSKEAERAARAQEKALEVATQEKIEQMRAQMNRQLKEMELSQKRELELLKMERDEAKELRAALEKQEKEQETQRQKTNEQATLMAAFASQMKMMQDTMSEAMNTPKQLVFDEDGKPVGVEPVKTVKPEKVPSEPMAPTSENNPE